MKSPITYVANVRIAMPEVVGAAGGIRTPDPRFRRHIPHITTKEFSGKYSLIPYRNVLPSPWMFNTISTATSTLTFRHASRPSLNVLSGLIELHPLATCDQSLATPITNLSFDVSSKLESPIKP